LDKAEKTYSLNPNLAFPGEKGAIERSSNRKKSFKKPRAFKWIFTTRKIGHDSHGNFVSKKYFHNK
jgi:hypothetical protein